jgi:DEAD/DEAH box helicase domain-containing protein
MPSPKNIDEYIESLLASKNLGKQVVYHKIIPPRPEKVFPLEGIIHEPVKGALLASGILNLYSHQKYAIETIRCGNNIVVATPTASGKTVIYNVPVLEKIIEQPDTKAIYVFPLKALAQDQLKTFNEMADKLSHFHPTAAVYDGDTTAWYRKKIRTNSPNVILTNPEMLHLSFLPYHNKWKELFENISTVVVDEVHTYRGVLGSHMAQILRRLQRVCLHYGSHPKFVFSSATIANPASLSEDLTGNVVKAETRNGAPSGKRHFVFINPYESPAHTAILLIKAALHRNLKTIVYTQSRKLAELISIWAGSQKGRFADKISAYRSGFLPEERRDIEKKLMSGELMAVISTSALELGIDIGDLDLCILVGYPGTVMSTWQRGGRVGRRGKDSAIVMVAGEDALDQYFMRNPEEFFNKEPEAAVINPHNPDISKKHIVCAAAELPIEASEKYFQTKTMKTFLNELEYSGELLKSGDGDTYYSSKKMPHRYIDLRGSGARFNIIDENSKENLGEIDAFRAFKETHPGAIYLHKGKTFCVKSLDIGSQIVSAFEADPAYYTRVRSNKDTEILEVYEEKKLFNTRIKFGRLKVTEQVTGYDKWHIYGKKKINTVPLELPPQIFETDGFWILIPENIQTAIEMEMLHFMGGIHAIEHAIIGICPLLVLTDRNDFGGISQPFHPQVKMAAIFVYDAFPGGVGLSREAYYAAENMLLKTINVIESCPCDTGCPACVHSPKCGSGNRPISKVSAINILNRLAGIYEGAEAFEPTDKTVLNLPAEESIKRKVKIKKRTLKNTIKENLHYGVLDIETQRSAAEVGGWHHADQMRVSCAILYDSQNNKYFEYLEKDVDSLIEHLKRFDLVIGFNIKRFDYNVLSGYSDFDFLSLPTLDILEKVYIQLGYRLSLDHLASVNIGDRKSADGLQALRWWKQGKIKEIIDYCKKDVELTRDIYILGQKNGFLLFKNKSGMVVRVPVDW